MSACGDVLEHMPYDTRVVDHERRSIGETERAGDAESLQYLSLRIGDKMALQVMLLRKATVRLDRIFGDPDDRCAGLVEVSGPLTELYRLGRSARRIILRIRPQDDVLLAAEVRQIERSFRRVAGDGKHRFADLDVRGHQFALTA